MRGDDKKDFATFCYSIFFYLVGKEEINKIREGEKNDFEDFEKNSRGRRGQEQGKKEKEKKRRQMSEERSGKPSWLQMWKWGEIWCMPITDSAIINNWPVTDINCLITSVEARISIKQFNYNLIYYRLISCVKDILYSIFSRI